MTYSISPDLLSNHSANFRNLNNYKLDHIDHIYQHKTDIWKAFNNVQMFFRDVFESPGGIIDGITNIYETNDEEEDLEIPTDSILISQKTIVNLNDAIETIKKATENSTPLKMYSYMNPANPTVIDICESSKAILLNSCNQLLTFIGNAYTSPLILDPKLQLLKLLCSQSKEPDTPQDAPPSNARASTRQKINIFIIPPPQSENTSHHLSSSFLSIFLYYTVFTICYMYYIKISIPLVK